MKKQLIKRDKYLNEALMFRDTDLVKVITGIRRCGKSSLLELVRQRIEGEGIEGRTFVPVNLEVRSFGIKTDDDLYFYIKERIGNAGHTYVFIDEVQRVEGWHDVVNSLRVETDCDIYLTGSNAYLLSSELSTYLSGRYVEIKMLPLAFSEYLDFCGLSFGLETTVATDADGNVVGFNDIFRRYLDFGGMPAIASLDIGQVEHFHYNEGLYNTVIVRDIMERERNRDQRKITDSDLLMAICEYLADTVGRQGSSSKIAGALTHAGRKTTHGTVAAYIKALEDTFVIYPCKRYDIRGKATLKTLPKYYIVDTGLRQYLNGYRGTDIGFVFENAVYLQLLFEGWSVHVGKLYQEEVDFIAVKDDRTLYIQVSDIMENEATRTRELAPLQHIGDNYEKMIVVRQGDHREDVAGIHILPAQDFFCS